MSDKPTEKPSPIVIILQIAFLVITYPVWKWAFIILFSMGMAGWGIKPW